MLSGNWTSGKGTRGKGEKAGVGEEVDMLLVRDIACVEAVLGLMQLLGLGVTVSKDGGG